jgi:phosphate:Na+ symporter
MMSESIEKAAGNRLKSILSTMTTNRFLGVFTGFLVTCFIQSSSATTVMVVSFVNAGLLNLTQSIGVIMGANIGTTITAWIVNLTGFKFDIIFFSFLAAILGIILMFNKNAKLKTWGGFAMGFSLLFIGLFFLKKSIDKDTITGSNQIYNFFQAASAGSNFGSVLLFVLLGALFTVVLQSSSATMAFTIVMINTGYIDLYHAAAMVLGENIGTTITANLAGLAGGRNAKKAAMAHTFFNIFGLIWMLFPVLTSDKMPVIFKAYLTVCEKASVFLPPIFKGSQNGVQLAYFHTLFNITNTALFIGFVPFYAKLIHKIFGKDKSEGEIALQNLKAGFINAPDLALLEAQSEIKNMADDAYRMFTKTCKLFNSGTKKEAKLYDQIMEIENKINKYESVIYNYLIDLLRDDTSEETTDRINQSLETIRMFEWIGDSCQVIARLVNKTTGSAEDLVYLHSRSQFAALQENLDKQFTLIIENREDLTTYEVQKESARFEERINALYRRMKKEAISDMGSLKKVKKKDIVSGLVFMDIIKELEHIGDALKMMVKVANT